MEGGLGLIGSPGGSSTNGSSSTVTKVEALEQDHNMGVVSSEAELELGLGLSLGGSVIKARRPFFLTAKDLVSASFCSSSSDTARANVNGNGPTSSSSCSSAVPNTAAAGTKKRSATDSVAQDVGSSNGASQVVGWPPIRAYRINSLVNQAKVPTPEDGDKLVAESCKGSKYDMKKNNVTLHSKTKADNAIGKGNRRAGSSLFVKVNMDGVPIGRKVDLSAHSCYETLAKILEDMFNGPTTIVNPICSREDYEVEATKPSKLLDGSSDFVLTYEDKEGDWMLVGDVPWGLFLDTVKRLRIMKTSEANGLAARFEDGNERQRKKPI